MVSKMRTDVIEKVDGSPVDLTGQSAAKAFCNCDDNATVNHSLNISSVVDKGTGLGKSFNFTNNFTDAEYPVVHWGKMSGGGYGAPWENDGWKLSESYQVNYNNHAGTVITGGEAVRLNVIAHGDLA